MRHFDFHLGRVRRDERRWVFAILGSTLLLAASATLMYGLLQAMAISRYGSIGVVAILAVASAALLFGAWLASRFMRRLRPAIQSVVLMSIGMLLTVGVAGARSHLGGAQAVVVFLAVASVAYGAFLAVAADRLKAASNEVFDYEQIQRLDPLFSAARTIGFFAGGMLLAFGAARWSGTSLFAIVATLVVGAEAALLSAWPEREFSTSLLTDTHDVPLFFWPKFESPSERRFLLLLGAIVGLSATFTGLFLYVFGAALASRFQTEQALGGFVGLYMGVGTLAAVMFATLAVSVLIRRRGVSQSLVILPFVVLCGATLMILVPSFWVVIVVVLARDIIITLQHTLFQTALEGMADDRRSRAWIWIDGPVTTAGSLLGALMAGVIGIWVAPQGLGGAVRAIGITVIGLLLVRFWLDKRFKRAFPHFLSESIATADFKGRLRAVQSFVELKHLKGGDLAPLIDLAKDEQEPPSLRVEAVRTLGTIGDPSVMRSLERLIAHPDHLIRLEMMRTISRMRWAEMDEFASGFSRHAFIGFLKYGFARETNREIIDAVIEALVALRDPDIVAFMLAAIAHPSAQVRHGALRSLRLFRDPAIIDVAKPFLNDKDPGIRAQAIAAIWPFAWERADASGVLGALMAGKPGSDECVWGLYLVGRLHLRDLLSEAARSLTDASPRTRIAAAIALLKNGDDRGMQVLERALAEETAGEAEEVERLADHPNVPETQRERITALVHHHHLHYPVGLPVSEPLRVRLHDIPAACLAQLQPFYANEVGHDGRKKIESALRAPGEALVKGRVMLIGVHGAWADMASVCLLAHGYAVRIGVASDAREPGERVVCGPKAKSCPAGAIRLVDRVTALSAEEVPTAHAAPSKLITKLEGQASGAMMIFGDRQEAGERLAQAVLERGIKADVILALPRGGVVLGRIVADALRLPLDVATPRRIGSKEDPELTVGAVTESGEVIWDKDYKTTTDAKWREAQVARETAEATRRFETFRAGMKPRDLRGKSVLIVDDGMANGFTMHAALVSAKAAGAARAFVAVPVASKESIARIKPLADDIVVLSVPEYFWAIAAYYQQFDQVEDAEALRLLKG